MSNDHKPLIAEVALDLKVDKVLEYLVPKNLEDKIKKGLRVKVPLRSKAAFGTVLTIKDKSSFKRNSLLKKLKMPKEMLILFF